MPPVGEGRRLQPHPSQSITALDPDGSVTLAGTPEHSERRLRPRDRRRRCNYTVRANGDLNAGPSGLGGIGWLTRDIGETKSCTYGLWDSLHRSSVTALTRFVGQANFPALSDKDMRQGDGVVRLYGVLPWDLGGQSQRWPDGPCAFTERGRARAVPPIFVTAQGALRGDTVLELGCDLPPFRADPREPFGVRMAFGEDDRVS